MGLVKEEIGEKPFQVRQDQWQVGIDQGQCVVKANILNPGLLHYRIPGEF